MSTRETNILETGGDDEETAEEGNLEEEVHTDGHGRSYTEHLHGRDRDSSPDGEGHSVGKGGDGDRGADLFQNLDNMNKDTWSHT